MRKTESNRPHLGRRGVVLALPLATCGLFVAPVRASANVYKSSRTLMGTRVDVTLQGSSSKVMEFAADAAFSEMFRLANMMSCYKENSALNAINLAAGLQPVAVPSELMNVLRMAHRVAREHAGCFDATVGSLSNWDFSSEHPSVPSAQQVAQQLKWVDQKNGLQLNVSAGTAYLTQRGMRLDLGGIAKLPILQAGIHKLEQLGIDNAMINGGGDVLVSGQLIGRPWRIGLRDPRQPDQLLGVVSLHQGFVAASGDYERFFIRNGKRLHHILDPKTGYPSQGPHGVVLIGEQLDTINGLGTAIMVAGAAAGREKLARIAGVDALIVDADNSVWQSPGMAQRLGNTI